MLVELARRAVPAENPPADRPAAPRSRSSARRALSRPGHRAVPRMLGGRGISRHDERRFALRVLEGCSDPHRPRDCFRRWASAAARLLGVLIFRPARQHRRDRPVCRHATGRPGRGACDDRPGARALDDPASPQELDRSRETSGTRRVVARVDGRAHEPAARLAARRGADPVARRGHRSRRRGRARRRARAGAGAVRAEGSVRRRIGRDEDIFRRALAPLEKVPA